MASSAPGATAPLSPKVPSERDLASATEARALAKRAREAQRLLAEFSQEAIDLIVARMAAAAEAHADALARLAVEETGFGVVADKVAKNLFAARDVHEFIRPIKTVGVIARHDDRRIVEIAEPFGVVAAIVPSTNPTSTAIYKMLISIKARCGVVLSPHPSAAGAITSTADHHERRGARGGPAGRRHRLDHDGDAPRHAGADALARHRRHPGHRRAGTRAGGLHRRQARLRRGPRQRAVLRRAIGRHRQGRRRHPHRQGVRQRRAVLVAELDCRRPRSRARLAGRARSRRRTFSQAPEAARLQAALVTPQRLPNPALVGKSAVHIAAAIGLTVPAATRALIAPLEGVGRDHPLSIEKLCPVLSYYVVADWREGCDRCKQILRYGGMGHTMSIHSQNEQVILEFGLHKPAFRICVNTSTTHGSIGLTTGLDPAMTLGCGGHGGNITSDNITPRHLLNIKRLAYELRPRGTGRRPAGVVAPGGAPASTLPPLPRAPRAPAADLVPADQVRAAIDRALAGRGAPQPAASAASVMPSGAAAEFVCEDDVRQAAREGKKLLVGPRTILTPSARDAGVSLDALIWLDGSAR